jgi:transposase
MASYQFTLPAAEATAFEAQRAATDYGYQQNLVQNAAQMQALNVEQTQARRDLARQLGRARQQLPGQYAQRGLLRSGIYGRGLGEFEEGRMMAESRQERGFGQRRQDLISALSQFDINRAMSLANIDLQEAQRRSAIAAMLQGAM